MDPVGESWPDAEGALRTWLRADSELSALIGNRVFFSFPKGGDEGNFPAVLLTRIGGSTLPTEAPIDNILFQFDVLGKLPDVVGGGLGPTLNVARTLCKVLTKLRGKTDLGGGVRAFDARISSQFDSPMPGDNRPRRIVTAVIPFILVPVP